MSAFPLAASALGVALTTVLAIPHIRQLASNRRIEKPADYQILNDNAEEEVIRAKTPEARWQRIVLTVTTLVATLAALLACVRARTTIQILQFVSWVRGLPYSAFLWLIGVDRFTGTGNRRRHPPSTPGQVSIGLLHRTRIAACHHHDCLWESLSL